MEEDSLIKMYTSLKRKHCWIMALLAILGFRLPMFFLLIERNNVLQGMINFEEVLLWPSVFAPIVAAFICIWVNRSIAAILGTICLIWSYVLLLIWDAEFALSRLEVMSIALSLFLVWTLWAIKGRITVLECFGYGR